MRRKANIFITLKSDLCASSGYGYAGIIDTDICVNENGFPYIPAKRLKGVMRQVAGFLYGENKPDEIKKIFGEGGGRYDKGIVVDDAVIQGTEEMNQEITQLKDNNITTLLTSQNVLEQFTSVRAQTKLDENGVALEDSLRYTRVVNQYLPEAVSKKQEEVVFVSTVEYEKEQEEIIRNIVRAVRHIGLDRNRGLGNVRCELVNQEDNNFSEQLNVDPSKKGKVKISYTVRNASQLMLSASKDDITEKYISGKNILGAMAAAYLNAKGLTEPDKDFNELFLSGKTIFSNLYITDGKRDYVPAPLFINRLKKTKKYVCVLKDYDAKEKESDKEGLYNPADGNQPKKLLNKYISLEGNEIHVMEPATELVYHHTKGTVYDSGRSGEDAEEGILYNMEVLSKNQLFSGCIITDAKYEKIIHSLLKNMSLRIGKSKSSQYGNCQIVKIDSAKEYEPATYDLKKDEKILVVFDSEAIIPGKYGYSTDINEVMNYIADQCKCSLIAENEMAASDQEKKSDLEKVYMSIKTITGYNTKINLKRASMPAIGAGSAFEFISPKDQQIQLDQIGAFGGEGYGKIHIIHEKAMTYKIKASEDEVDNSGVSINKCKVLEEEIYRNVLMDVLKKNYLNMENQGQLGEISSSLVGRVTLMLKESRQNKDVLDSFGKRIMSIKRNSERKTIIEWLKKLSICEITKDNNAKDYKIENKMKDLKDNITAELTLGKQEDFLKEETDCILETLWVDYLAFILLHIKYKKSVKNNTKK